MDRLWALKKDLDPFGRLFYGFSAIGFLLRITRCTIYSCPYCRWPFKITWGPSNTLLGSGDRVCWHASGALAPEELSLWVELTHRTGEGWTYFVTTKSWENTFWFQVIKAAQIVVEKMLEYRDKENYLLHDFVLMPNHLHLILTPSSASLEKCMQLIKGGSSFEIHKLRGSRTEIWQPGFHESRVKNCSDYQKKRDYVMFNPVAAKLVERPELWLFGSARGKFRLDPIPQGLKPTVSAVRDVGPEGPTPNTPSEAANS